MRVRIQFQSSVYLLVAIGIEFYLIVCIYVFHRFVLVCKMKNKSVNLETLWDRAVEARKVESASPSVLQPVTVESDAQPQNPSVVPVTTEPEAQNKIAISQRSAEPEIGSNGPDI